MHPPDLTNVLSLKAGKYLNLTHLYSSKRLSLFQSFSLSLFDRLSWG